MVAPALCSERYEGLHRDLFFSVPVVAWPNSGSASLVEAISCKLRRHINTYKQRRPQRPDCRYGTARNSCANLISALEILF